MNTSVFSRRNFTVSSDGKLNLFKVDVDITQYPAKGQYIVSDQDIGKPWLISNKVYGQPNLWWFILKYNNVKSVSDGLVVGMVLKYPDISVYYSLYDRYIKV